MTIMTKRRARVDRSRSRVGIDIDTNVIRAAEVTTTPTGRTLHAWINIPRSSPGPSLALHGTDAQRLAEALERRGMRTHGVTLGLAPSSLLRASAELPPASSGAPLAQLAAMELARVHKRDPMSLTVDWWPVPPPERGPDVTSAHVVGVPSDECESLLATLEKQGLRVACIDVRELALHRACTPLLPKAAGAAILDLGWSSAAVMVIHRGIVAFERSIDDASVSTLASSLGAALVLDAEHAALALHALGIDDARWGDAEQRAKGLSILNSFADALVREVRASLAYATHRYPSAEIATLVCAGEHASMPGLVARLSQSLGIHVVAASSPHLAFFNDGEPNDDSCASAAAIGLAIPALEAAA
jgi:Tfp pilus assembly PilM family ATPase